MRLVLFILCATSISAQFISFGITGGVPLSDEFKTRVISPNGIFGMCAECATSQTVPYLIGPSMEIGIWGPLSFTAGAMFSRADYIYTEYIASMNSTTHTVNRWEVPLMLKFKMNSWHNLSPFVAAGVSFQSSQDYARSVLDGGFSVSGTSVLGRAALSGPPVNSTGAGAVFALGVSYGRARIRPTIEYRFTRWADALTVIHPFPTFNVSLPTLHSNQNQSQLVAGLMFDLGDDAGGRGGASSSGGATPERKIRFGVKAGMPLSPALTATSHFVSVSDFGTCFTECSSQRTVPYVVGPAVEVSLARSYSVTAEAVYSRVDYNHSATVGDRNGESLADTKHTIDRWEFPLLLKYTGRSRLHLRPFAAGGVSVQYVRDREATRLDGSGIPGSFFFPPAILSLVRSVGPLDSSTAVGPTFALGARLAARTPYPSLEFRYTRWIGQATSAGLTNLFPNATGAPILYSNQNQFQFLFGLTF